MISKVSIIISCYNQAKYLSKAIDSFINQTYSNIELIVADDGSTDNTAKVIKSYEDKKLPIQFKAIYQKNKNVFPTFDDCFRNYATGDYIGFCEADSMWEPFIIEDFINELKNDNADYVYCSLASCDEQYNIIRIANMKEEHNKSICWGVCSIFKRQLYLDLDGFNEQFQAQDIEFYFRLALTGAKFSYLDKLGYRTIDHETTGRFVDRWNNENKKRVDEDIYIINQLKLAWLKQNKPIIHIKKFCRSELKKMLGIK